MKEWPEDKTEVVAFDDLVGPLAELLKDNYRRRCKVVRYPSEFEEFYDIGKYERACTPPVDETLNPEGLQYHAERDRDLIDVVLGIAIQYGIEQGRRMSEDEHKFKFSLFDHYEKYYNEAHGIDKDNPLGKLSAEQRKQLGEEIAKRWPK